MIARFLILSVLVVSSFALVRASEKEDFRVNDDVGSAEQNDPRIAVSADGRSVIVWVDRRRQSKDIYLQQFDPDGNPIGINQKINDDTLNAFQATPSVGSDASGLYRVVWQDYREGFPLKPGIFYQTFDSTVRPLSPNSNLTSTAIDQQRESPDIALAADGRGIVVWADYRNQNWDIFGQRLDVNGLPVGGNFQINEPDNAQQHSPRVSMGPQGWFVVCWYDNSLGNDDVYTQTYDASGNKIGSVLKINNDVGTERQVFPDVAADGLGRYTVVWVDYRNSHYPNNPDIYATKLDTNGVYLSSNIKLNSDATTRAQKYPSISADRMGNVAIIWSDSTLTSWDIIGQMIDVDGVVREVNFQANSSADSAQFKADVALDGRFRYITWVDSREDRLFDIYASISQYNERSLIFNPPLVSFEMVRGSGFPASQKVVVEHTGYNAINYTISFSASWLDAVSNTGTTPDTITVSIIDSSLAKGTYFADINLSDPLSADSLFVLSVRLDVTSPTIGLSRDTVSFVVPEGVDRDYFDEVEISNTGSGEFLWDAFVDASWLNLSQFSGSTPDTVALSANGIGLVAGSYETAVEIRADEADNSPESLFVLLDVRNDFPILSVMPESIVIATGVPELVDTMIIVSNSGQGMLDWNAWTSSLWLNTDLLSGNRNVDTIRFQLDASLLELGSNLTTVYVTDSSSLNLVDSVIVDITVYEGGEDTIRIEPTQMGTNEVGLVPVTFTATNNISRLFLPLTYESQYLTVDSILPMMSTPDWMDLQWSVDGLSSEIQVELISNNPESSLISGTYPLVALAVTTLSQDVAISFQPVEYDSIRPYIVTESGLTLKTAFEIGPLRIGSPTDLDGFGFGALPMVYELHQNYPNPFNATTQISFDLPRRSHVELSIFDVLGRTVATIIDQWLGPGQHTVEWNGLLSDGGGAASGIYFYRLQAFSDGSAPDFIESRKLLLLK